MHGERQGPVGAPALLLLGLATGLLPSPRPAQITAIDPVTLTASFSETGDSMLAIDIVDLTRVEQLLTEAHGMHEGAK